MRQVIGILCFFNLCVGLTMLLPLGISLWEGEKETLDFLKGVILAVLVGGLGSIWGLRGKITIGRRGAFAIVSFGWLTASLSGLFLLCFQAFFLHWTPSSRWSLALLPQEPR